MHRRLILTLGVALSLSLGAASAGVQADEPAPKSADALLALLGDEVAAVRPYQAYGIDLRRGFEVSLKPVQNTYGDCRAQRLTLFVKRYPFGDPRNDAPAELDHLELENRFRRPGWVERNTARDCGDPLVGEWITAPSDYDFYMSAKALAQVRRAALAGGTAPFTLTCADMGPPCRAPLAKLREAFEIGTTEVAWAWGADAQTITARHSPRGATLWTMTITTGAQGQVTAVDLRFQFPPLS